MKRTILWAILIIAWFLGMCTDAHCATTYYNTTAQGAGTGANAANAKALSSMATDVASASCGDNFYIAAGATLTDNDDWLTISRTGCTSGTKITIRKDPAESASSTHPRITGDWSPSAPDTGDAAIKLRSDVDYVDIIDINLRGYQNFIYTGNSSLSALSASHDGEGLNNNITIKASDSTNPLVWDQFQTGIVIFGAPNASCGATHSTCDDNGNLPAGTSGAWTIQYMNLNDFSHRAILIRNGAGDANTEGTGNGIIIRNVSCNGGGATYDKSGNYTGQGCIDIGQTSANTGTPDSNILMEDITCVDLNNRNSTEDPSTGKYKNGDCIKTEPETNNILIRRVSCTQIVDSCVDSKSVKTDIYDSVASLVVHCWKSYSNIASGRITRGHNLLCHDNDNPWGAQPVHAIQTFGEVSCENCSSINLNVNSASLYKLQDSQSHSIMTLVNSLGAFDSSGGTGLTNCPAYQQSGTCGSSSTCTFTATNTLCYDAEGAVTSGTDPGFGTMDENYYDVNDTAACQAFEPSDPAYDGIGFRCINPITPFTAPTAPTSLTCTAINDTRVDCSWTAPVLDDFTPFITGYLVERESPIGGGFSTVTTVTGEDLTNGDMESGTSSWSLHDTEGGETLTTEATIIHGGSGSIKIIVDDHDEGVKQNIVVADSDSCTASAWVYIPTGTDPSDVKAYAKEEGGDYTTYSSVAASTNDAWQLLQTSFTKGADSNQLRFSVSASTPITPTVTYYVDDASVVCGGVNTSYSNTGLTASTQYNYRISAINSIGTGASSTADATTTAATGGTGEAKATGTGGQVVHGPGCAFGRS